MRNLTRDLVRVPCLPRRRRTEDQQHLCGGVGLIGDPVMGACRGVGCESIAAEICSRAMAMGWQPLGQLLGFLASWLLGFVGCAGWWFCPGIGARY
jgi:hypothetical protein